MNDDVKKAKALQKEYIKARAAKETTDDMLTWLLKRKASNTQLKGFGMAKHKRRSKRYSGFGDGFGLFPAVFALPLLAKIGLAAGAAYLVLKKKPATASMRSQLVGGQAPATVFTQGMSHMPGTDRETAFDVMGAREDEGY